MPIGVPVKLLHEAISLRIKCETLNGAIYEGNLSEVENNMNCIMTDVTVIYQDMSEASFNTIYIRGSKVRYFILPDQFDLIPLPIPGSENKPGNRQNNRGGRGHGVPRQAGQQRPGYKTGGRRQGFT